MPVQLLAAIILIIILALTFYLNSKTKNNVSLVKSTQDGNEYLTQNLRDQQKAADMLAIVSARIIKLKKYLVENIHLYPRYEEYIRQLNLKLKGVVLHENSPKSKHTSYTVNKGDEIVLCLRSKKTLNLHNINLVMYVVIHELAHVACPELNHTPLFQEIFIFLLRISIQIGIYQYVDYQIDPHEYCGLIINENLLSDAHLY